MIALLTARLIEGRGKDHIRKCVSRIVKHRDLSIATLKSAKMVSDPLEFSSWKKRMFKSNGEEISNN